MKGLADKVSRKMKEDEDLKAGIGQPWTVEVISLTKVKGKDMIILFFGHINNI